MHRVAKGLHDAEIADGDQQPTRAWCRRPAAGSTRSLRVDSAPWTKACRKRSARSQMMLGEEAQGVQQPLAQAIRIMPDHDQQQQAGRRSGPRPASRRSRASRLAPGPAMRPKSAPGSARSRRSAGRSAGRRCAPEPRRRSATKKAPAPGRAIRYGRTNSPARPSRVMAVKPMIVAENRLHMLGCGCSGLQQHRPAQRPAVVGDQGEQATAASSQLPLRAGRASPRRPASEIRVLRSSERSRYSAASRPKRPRAPATSTCFSDEAAFPGASAYACPGMEK